MFENIRPYNDAETAAALKKISTHPAVDQICEFVFPGMEPSLLRELLASVDGVDDFQTKVMYPAVKNIINNTTDGLSFGGLEYFTDNPDKRYLLLSNHRDIVLDSAFIQFILKDHGLPLSEIAVGDNLLYDKFVEDLIMSNRMIKVVRSENIREVYESSRILSDYIRLKITSTGVVPGCGSGASIWIAHRNGRTKNGVDQTEQGLLKMLNMSGNGNFISNFAELNVMPVSISYEIEPCGLKKAMELWIRGTTGSYVKRPGEDLASIAQGIVQKKGRVHIEFCKPITMKELEDADRFDKNDKFRRLAEICDSRILDGYRLWPNNKFAWKMLSGEKCDDNFTKYVEKQMVKLSGDCDRDAVRKIFLGIYAAPYGRKMNNRLDG